jgi:hypothetical protein
MKYVSFFSHFAALSFATFVASLALGTQTLAPFAIAVSAFILLIVAGDYAPHNQPRRQPVGAVVGFPATSATVAKSSDKLAA